jgi:hypothetical protein
MPTNADGEKTMRFARFLILGTLVAGLAACATHPGQTSASGPAPHYQQAPRNNPDAGLQRYMGGGPTYF